MKNHGYFGLTKHPLDIRRRGDHHDMTTHRAGKFSRSSAPQAVFHREWGVGRGFAVAVEEVPAGFFYLIKGDALFFENSLRRISNGIVYALAAKKLGAWRVIDDGQPGLVCQLLGDDFRPHLAHLATVENGAFAPGLNRECLGNSTNIIERLRGLDLIDLAGIVRHDTASCLRFVHASRKMIFPMKCDFAVSIRSKGLSSNVWPARISRTISERIISNSPSV